MATDSSAETETTVAPEVPRPSKGNFHNVLPPLVG